MTSSNTSFGLGSFSLAGCPPFPGIVLDGETVIALSALRPLCESLGLHLPEATTTLSVIEQWSATLPAIQAAVDAMSPAQSGLSRRVRALGVAMTGLRVHPPVQSRQILLCGANYFRHVVDMIVDWGPGKSPGTENMSVEELRAFAEDLMRKRQKEGSPYIFTKPVSVLSGAYDPIELPRHTTQPDWELELAAVIRRPARHVKRENAFDFIAGYTIVNDITNRDRIFLKDENKVFGTDWISAKCAPTYLPVGPYIVPSTHVPDPQKLQLELKLNGRTMQNDNTSDMIFGVARLIEHISGLVQLMPGDLVCTGSPAGNGTHFNRYLQPGDVVDGMISGLGAQRTPIIEERSS